MQLIKDWESVIVEMIRSQQDQSISGARARTTIERIAKEKGLVFPPPEMEGQKFYDFLASFPNLLALRKRPHQDFLIAPAERPELLASVPTARGRASRLRKDIYEALTKPGEEGKKAFYSAFDDLVIWRLPDEPIDGEIPFPDVVPPEEDRAAYAIENAAADELLPASHNEASFSSLIRDKGLGRDWHEFRLRQLINRLKQWAEHNQINWGNRWIEGQSPVDFNHELPSATAGPIATRAHEAINALRLILTDDELRRISVPMDLVLKLLESKQ